MYLSLKALHLIFVVAWFAGLFYIFRLFVYHRQNSSKQDICQLLSVMQRRLLFFITIPASIVVTLLGVAMIYLNPSLLVQAWLWWKLLFVAVLLLYQWFSYKTYLNFKANNFHLSEKACRVVNEVPTVLLIIIVFIAIKKF